MAIEKYEKFLVLKWEDIDRHLAGRDFDDLVRIKNLVLLGKHGEAILDPKIIKPSYYVVNTDEPYSKAVWELIRMGEKMKGEIK